MIDKTSYNRMTLDKVMILTLVAENGLEYYPQYLFPTLHYWLKEYERRESLEE